MEANQITVSDADLRKGAEEGMDAFLKVFIDKYLEVTGGKINADTMPLLNGYQHKDLRCPSRGFGEGTYGRGVHGHV